MTQALVELWPILLYFTFTLVLLGAVMFASSLLGPRTPRAFYTFTLRVWHSVFGQCPSKVC